MIADAINGAFELFGGLFLLRNCWQLYRDKAVRGVSVSVTGFFTAWGVWNLYYYPSLDQWLSFAGGCMIVVSNAIWVAMAIHYRRR